MNVLGCERAIGGRASSRDLNTSSSTPCPLGIVIIDFINSRAPGESIVWERHEGKNKLTRERTGLPKEA